jgi:hypothetical protein
LPEKRYTAIVMGVILVPALPFECIMRRLSRRSSKQSNFSEKCTQKCDNRTTIDMCYRLVNVYQIHHQPSVTSSETYQKIED